MFKNKRNAKIIAIAVVAFFVLGVVGIAVSQSGSSKAAGTSSNIGKVNYGRLVTENPEWTKMQQTMQTEYDQAKKDFDEKSKSMNDQEKEQYYNQLKERLDLKEQELKAPIFDKVNAAVKTVADAKGIAVVMDAGNVVYGGQDLTDDVMKNLTGK
ncbi:MAG TPA: OmpH family outer membrane protein [Methylomusa anaerophila]|uniref:OmpH family outer membrane protein n=1 Tax=Methylomusa anaerophila TaxID=1930071 RepID=UPI001E40F81B|nr:OmpH family outer membrane protein [Methylomusa anaerophila]HML89507.1 OmpH family outer membrane protein [Methylomusa anaerophila]